MFASEAAGRFEFVYPLLCLRKPSPTKRGLRWVSGQDHQAMMTACACNPYVLMPRHAHPAETSPGSSTLPCANHPRIGRGHKDTGGLPLPPPSFPLLSLLAVSSELAAAGPCSGGTAQAVCTTPHRIALSSASSDLILSHQPAVTSCQNCQIAQSGSRAGFLPVFLALGYTFSKYDCTILIGAFSLLVSSQPSPSLPHALSLPFSLSRVRRLREGCHGM